MKKKIAFLLAAVMIIAAAIPMHVFAVSTAEVTKTYSNTGKYTLITNYNVPSTDSGLIQVTPEGTFLRLVLSSAAAQGDEFTLTLTGADWAFGLNTAKLFNEYYDDDVFQTSVNEPTALGIPGATSANISTTTTPVSVHSTAVGRIKSMTLTDGGASFAPTVARADMAAGNPILNYTMSFSALNRSKATVILDAAVQATSTTPRELYIPLVVVTKDANAAVTIALTHEGSQKSPFTTFASRTIVDIPGAAVISIEGVVESREEFTLENIHVKEKKSGDFVNGGTFYLVAPSGYYWSQTQPLAKHTWETTVFSGDPVASIRTLGGPLDEATVRYGTKRTGYDANQILVVTFSGNLSTLRGTRLGAGEIILKELVLLAEDNATFDKDVVVRVLESRADKTEVYRNGVYQNTTNAKLNIADPYYVELTVAKRVNYGITFKITDDKVPSIYAGLNRQEISTVLFQENTPVSWWAHNITDFTLVDAEGKSLQNKVKFTAVTMDDSDNFEDQVDLVDVVPGDKETNVRLTDNMYTIANAPIVKGEKGYVQFLVEISAAANYAGPVYLHASGRGIPADSGIKGDVLIANVVAPVTIETKTTYIQVGYQTVAVENITVKEAEAGVFLKGEEIWLRTEAFGVEDGDTRFIDTENIKFTQAGSGLLATPTYDGWINIEVLRSSNDVAQEFTLSNVKVYVNRSVPEGKWDVAVGGWAFVDNYSFGVTPTPDGQFNRFGVSYANYVEVVTQGLNKALSKNVVVTTNEPTSVIVDGVVHELDAPIYIDVVTNRTMVPIRFISMALGIEEKNVIWNNTDRKVIIVTAERTVEFFIDTNIFTINGAAQKMVENGIEVKSVIQPSISRSYIPFTYLAQALGITVAWDGEKRLAIFNPTLEQKNAGAKVIDNIPVFNYQ